MIVGWNGCRLSFDQAMQTGEALTNKDHVAESYMTVDRLSNPGPITVIVRPSKENRERIVKRQKVAMMTG